MAFIIRLELSSRHFWMLIAATVHNNTSTTQYSHDSPPRHSTCAVGRRPGRTGRGSLATPGGGRENKGALPSRHTCRPELRRPHSSNLISETITHANYLPGVVGSSTHFCSIILKLLLLAMAPGVPNPAKMALRGEVSARIAALTADEKKRQSEIIFNKVIKHSWYKSSSRIALYMSTDQEVDTMALIDHVKARGAAAFVPQYAGGHMKMLRVQSGDEDQMELTRHGIAQHAPGAVREDAFDHGGLDLIIAPGLAFTRSGKRLGHGGGYYDKYLAKVRAGSVATKVIALAFTCQVVEDLPVDENDQRIDEVISADL